MVFRTSENNDGLDGFDLGTSDPWRTGGRFSGTFVISLLRSTDCFAGSFVTTFSVADSVVSAINPPWAYSVGESFEPLIQTELVEAGWPGTGIEVTVV